MFRLRNRCLCGDDESSLSASNSEDDEDDFDAPYRLASEHIKRERALSGGTTCVAFVNQPKQQSPLRSVPELHFGFDQQQEIFNLSDVQSPSTPNENNPPPRTTPTQTAPLKAAAHYKSPERTVQAVRALDNNANCIPTASGGASGPGSSSTSSPRAPGDRKRANEQSAGKVVAAGAKALGSGSGDALLLLKAPSGVVPPSPTGVAAAPKRQAEQRTEVSWVDVIDGQAEFDDDPLFY